MAPNSLLHISAALSQDAWSEVDIVEAPDDSALYGRGFVITHSKSVRLRIAMDVDELLKAWSNDDDLETVIRWISGTNRESDQLMVGLIAPSPEPLGDFRNKMLGAISKVDEANIVPITGWLRGFLSDRQAA